jgi:hypothetical protein
MTKNFIWKTLFDLNGRLEKSEEPVTLTALEHAAIIQALHKRHFVFKPQQHVHLGELLLKAEKTTPKPLNDGEKAVVQFIWRAVDGATVP